MATEQNNQPQLALKRLYLKDLSFESPGSPQIFQQEFNPKLHIDISNKNKKVDDEHYEVILEVTVTAHSASEEVIFVAEVEQAGLFFIKGIEGEPLNEILGIFCPNMIFPYVRETIDNIVVKGSFPPLILAPINFEHMYKEAQKDKSKPNLRSID